MSQIKNIIFDMGVVLVDLDRSGCIDAFRALGIDHLEKMTGLAMHQGIFQDFERGNLSRSQFYDAVRALSARSLSDESICQAWTRMVHAIPDYKLNKILELRSQYRIFLLSNTNEIHWDYCANKMFHYQGHTWEDFFEKRWLSNEIHLLKPDPAIFQYVLKDAAITAHETLFIDDAFVNCQTAQSLGFHTYQPQVAEDWTPIFDTDFNHII